MQMYLLQQKIPCRPIVPCKRRITLNEKEEIILKENERMIDMIDRTLEEYSDCSPVKKRSYCNSTYENIKVTEKAYINKLIAQEIVNVQNTFNQDVTIKNSYSFSYSKSKSCFPNVLIYIKTNNCESEEYSPVPISDKYGYISVISWDCTCKHWIIKIITGECSISSCKDQKKGIYKIIFS